jgi:hypothetical protein
MNKRVIILLFDIIINVILPILIAVFIYRISFVNENALIKNYFPDALWAYALASSILIIWKREVNYFWLFIIIVFFVVFEILQYLHFIKGTGDVWDVLTYLIATFIAIIINNILKLYFYKTNTTL